jgi:hypothetical protein
MQGQGTTIGHNPTSWATAYVDLAKLTRIPFPATERAWIDMSALDSPDNWEEGEIALLKRGVELEHEYNSTEATMAAVQTLVELEAISYFKVDYGGTKFFWYTGYVLKHNPGEAALDSKVSGRFTIRTTGPVYHQTAAPT